MTSFFIQTFNWRDGDCKKIFDNLKRHNAEYAIVHDIDHFFDLYVLAQTREQAESYLNQVKR